MGDLRQISAPLLNRLFASIYRKADTFLSEEVVQSCDVWRIFLVNEWMVDFTDRSAGLDASITIDCENLVEPGLVR